MNFIQKLEKHGSADVKLRGTGTGTANNAWNSGKYQSTENRKSAVTWDDRGYEFANLTCAGY